MPSPQNPYGSYQPMAYGPAQPHLATQLAL
jgi:hypothetical protein